MDWGDSDLDWDPELENNGLRRLCSAELHAVRKPALINALHTANMSCFGNLMIQKLHVWSYFPEHLLGWMSWGGECMGALFLLRTHYNGSSTQRSSVGKPTTDTCDNWQSVTRAPSLSSPCRQRPGFPNPENWEKENVNRGFTLIPGMQLWHLPRRGVKEKPSTSYLDIFSWNVLATSALQEPNTCANACSSKASIWIFDDWCFLNIPILVQ